MDATSDLVVAEARIILRAPAPEPRINHTVPTKANSTPGKRIGLALGSGSARGMAHIGVIERLREIGLAPDIVAGTSIGAVIAACYVQDKLQHFHDWVSGLSTAEMFRLADVSLIGTGGLANGSGLMEFMREEYGDPNIEALDVPFAAVATDLYSGREIWLQEGSLWSAVRASMALPGILTPIPRGDRWLVDGGLVNPVPISVCRALGADLIIGVNLNADLLRSAPRLADNPDTPEVPREETQQAPDAEKDEDQFSAIERFAASIKGAARELWSSGSGSKKHVPGTLNVMMNTINIMQDRITRSRLAGEPADVMLSPRLGDFGLMEFDRASEAVEEGRRAVDRMLPTLQYMLELESGFPNILKTSEKSTSKDSDHDDDR